MTICPGLLLDVDGYVGVVLGRKGDEGRRWGVLVAQGDRDDQLETIELDVEDVEGLLPWTDTEELKRAADRCRLSGRGMVYFMHQSLGGAR